MRINATKGLESRADNLLDHTRGTGNAMPSTMLGNCQQVQVGCGRRQYPNLRDRGRGIRTTEIDRLSKQEPQAITETLN